LQVLFSSWEFWFWFQFLILAQTKTKTDNSQDETQVFMIKLQFDKSKVSQSKSKHKSTRWIILSDRTPHRNPHLTCTIWRRSWKGQTNALSFGLLGCWQTLWCFQNWLWEEGNMLWWVHHFEWWWSMNKMTGK
jgi:hypothetical protein